MGRTKRMLTEEQKEAKRLKINKKQRAWYRKNKEVHIERVKNSPNYNALDTPWKLEQNRLASEKWYADNRLEELNRKKKERDQKKRAIVRWFCDHFNVTINLGDITVEQIKNKK